MIIAIDFDGTCVTHSFPLMGKDIGAIPILKALVNNGHKLILYTMRSNMLTPNSLSLDDDIIPDQGEMFLNQAIKWFNDNNIPLWGIQTNPQQKRWTESPKTYAQLYIDDAALGCPLIYPENEKPYVNWKKVEEILKEKEIL